VLLKKIFTEESREALLTKNVDKCVIEKNIYRRK